MHEPNSEQDPAVDDEGRHPRVRWLFIVCVVIILIGFLRSRHHDESTPAPVSADRTSRSVTAADFAAERAGRQARLARPPPMPTPTAEEIVAGKLAQFARSRRDFVYALARRHKVEVPADVEHFFAAVESGNWDEIEGVFGSLRADNYDGAPRSNELRSIWPAILDAYGVAEQVHLWPAQKLLDYGNAVLDSLRPGMIYVGGTDNGRWVPELLNDTSDSERHVIVTQNGLADGTYLDYLRLQYDDRFANLSDEDSKRAFAEYMADAEKHLKHDQEFPEEPKQLRPGEDVRFSDGPLKEGLSDGRVQVSGQVAVMSINEKLLHTLMQKNPGLSFAIQESFPLKGTYPDALPLGPLMELRAQNGENTFTPERAAEWLDYWRNTTRRIFSDPEAAASDTALKSYSHDTVAAANLLAAHNYNAEAEQAYRLGMQLSPTNPEAVGGLADLLAGSGREAEARQLLGEFSQKYPDQRKHLERVSSAVHFIQTSASPRP